MQLSDFFQSFNFFNLSVFGLFLILMDYLGYKIAKILKISNIFRFVFWIIGLGFFTFIWFILHFFIPFYPEYIWASLVPILIFFTVIKREYSIKGFLQAYKEFFSFVLLFIPFAKIVFFRISLPPRLWDEMAYHFYSPARLFYEHSWNFSSMLEIGKFDFYMMLPRTIDTIYVLIFSLTKTYVTAQLLHTLIYLSVILLISSFLKKKLGMLSAIVFQFLSLYLNPELLFSANTGYIDTATAALAIIPLISLYKLVEKPDLKNLRASALFSAIAIGAKYTVVSYLVSIWAVSILIIVLNDKKLIKKIFEYFKNHPIISSFQIILLAIISIAGGGYWYLKNLIIAGNPTHPFSFFCRSCSKGTDALQGWNYLDFNFSNISEIVFSIFHYNAALLLIFAFGIFFIFTNKTKSLKNKKSLKNLLWIIVGGFFVEYTLLNNVGNYTSRFFYHWPILVSLVLSLPYGELLFSKSSKKYLSFFLFSLILAVFSIFLSTKPIGTALSKLTDNDRWFARGKISFTKWLNPKMPHVFDIIKSCGEPQEMRNYLTADPNMIWGEYGLSRVFLVNCNYQHVKLDQTAEKTLEQISDDLPILSTENCDPNRDKGLTNKRMIEYNKLNQMLVCDREETDYLIYTK